MDHSFIQGFAKSWGLIYLLVLFAGAIFFTFRPGSKKIADDSAQIPFKEDE